MNIRLFLSCIIVAAVGLLVVGVKAADEIITQVYLKGEKGFSKVERSPGSINIDWNGNGAFHSTIVTGTTAYVSLFPQTVTVNGIAYFRNLSTDTTWTVSFNGGTNDHLQLKSGEFSLMRLHSTLVLGSVKGKGGTTNTQFESTILED